MEKVGTYRYSKSIWNSVWRLGNLVAIWYIFHRFGILCQEKSGNPDRHKNWLGYIFFSELIRSPWSHL
jgi:hypothetical protein